MSNKQAFSIAETPLAFRVLSSSLYSQPELAILRELSCNAYDAQVDANTNEEHTISLHIPERNNEVFYIRDWGKGLDEDEVFLIYTQFFTSTKTSRDDQVGAFGLGSKSPFSLTDEYRVNSYQNGQVKKYLMKIENDLPTVTLEATEDTLEHDGLEVIIEKWNNPINYSAWMNAADKLFSTTVFLPNANFDNPKYIEKHRKFYTRESISNTRCWNENTININVAGVGFSLSESETTNLFSRNELGILYSFNIERLNLIARKEDVDLTPSREALHLSDKTKNFIKKATFDLIERFYSQKDLSPSIVSLYYDMMRRSSTNFEAIREKLPTVSNKVYEVYDKVCKVFNIQSRYGDNYRILKIENHPGKKIPFTCRYLAFSELSKELKESNENHFFTLDIEECSVALKKSFETTKKLPASVTSPKGLVRGNLVNTMYSHFAEASKNLENYQAFYFLEPTNAVSDIFKVEEVALKNYKSYFFNFKDDTKKLIVEKEKSENPFEGKFFVSSTKYFYNGQELTAFAITSKKEKFSQKKVISLVEETSASDMRNFSSYLKNISSLIGTDYVVAGRRGSSEWIEKIEKEGIAVSLDNFYKNFKKDFRKKFLRLKETQEVDELKSFYSMREFFEGEVNGYYKIDPLLKETESYKVFIRSNMALTYGQLGLNMYNGGYRVLKEIFKNEKPSKSFNDSITKLTKEKETFKLLNIIKTNAFYSKEFSSEVVALIEVLKNEYLKNR